MNIYIYIYIYEYTVYNNYYYILQSTGKRHGHHIFII